MPERYFLDTEFIENSQTLSLISLGLVCSDGREFYAEVDDFQIPWDQAGDWVLANVRANLRAGDKWRKEDLAGGLRDFVAGGGGSSPEFWGYYADYDWVLLCRLFGRMLDLPKGWPHVCLDLKQWAKKLGDPPLPAQGGTEHCAVDDARWDMEVWQFLDQMERGKS